MTFFLMEAASGFRNRVIDYIEGGKRDLTFNQVLAVGQAAFNEYDGGDLESFSDAIKDTDFADSLTERLPWTAKTVVQSLCLAAVFTFEAMEADRLMQSDRAMAMLLQAAAQLGFIAGAYETSVEVGSERSTRFSRAGAKGAAAAHKKRWELKQWALSESTKLRGADADIARRLAAMLPHELADVSKSPERLIYDALREARKAPGS